MGVSRPHFMIYDWREVRGERGLGTWIMMCVLGYISSSPQRSHRQVAQLHIVTDHIHDTHGCFISHSERESEGKANEEMRSGSRGNEGLVQMTLMGGWGRLFFLLVFFLFLCSMGGGSVSVCSYFFKRVIRV